MFDQEEFERYNQSIRDANEAMGKVEKDLARPERDTVIGKDDFCNLKIALGPNSLGTKELIAEFCSLV